MTKKKATSSGATKTARARAAAAANPVKPQDVVEAPQAPKAAAQSNASAGRFIVSTNGKPGEAVPLVRRRSSGADRSRASTRYIGPAGISWLQRWRIALGQPVDAAAEPQPALWLRQLYRDFLAHHGGQ